jgi:phosphotransferase system  glucose/maltose/N-acetylglucosamine-specific IIC component
MTGIGDRNESESVIGLRRNRRSTCTGIYTSTIIEMPYSRWLDRNLPSWLAILCVVIFALCFIFLAIPGRSLNYYYFVVFGWLLSALLLKASIKKSWILSSSILSFAVILFTGIRHYYRKKKADQGSGIVK